MNTLTNFASGVVESRNDWVETSKNAAKHTRADTRTAHNQRTVLVNGKPEVATGPLAELYHIEPDPGWPTVSLVPRSTFNNGEMICV